LLAAVFRRSRTAGLRAADLPLHGLGAGRELNRAIAAGLIVVEHKRANLCRLFASERDRQRWHLAHEALTPGTKGVMPGARPPDSAPYR